jgi:hypothetical protein
MPAISVITPTAMVILVVQRIRIRVPFALFPALASGVLRLALRLPPEALT